VNAVFADTFFYQALLDERDRSHGHALAQSKVKRTILTTEFILLELGMPAPAQKIMRTFLLCWPAFAPVRARGLFPWTLVCYSEALIYSLAGLIRTGPSPTAFPLS
jgi:hypothetical protein